MKWLSKSEDGPFLIVPRVNLQSIVLHRIYAQISMSDPNLLSFRISHQSKSRLRGGVRSFEDNGDLCSSKAKVVRFHLDILVKGTILIYIL